MKVEAALAEEKADKRVEIYAQSVKKSRKRKRMFEDDEEEMVPGVLLHAEEMRNQVSKFGLNSDYIIVQTNCQSILTFIPRIGNKS